MRGAWSFGRRDRDIIAVALAGFMLRGGIVLLAIPGVVLPSVVGLAAMFGGLVGIDGSPTPLFFEVLAVVCLLAAAWLVVALLLGSLVDLWLVEAAESDDDSVREPHPFGDPTDLLSLAGIRTVCLLLPAAAVLWAYPQIHAAVYAEFLTPSELATPYLLRVVLHAAFPVAVVVLAWLISEVVGAIAVRRLLFTDCSAWQALWGSLDQIVRRPLSSMATIAVAYGASAVALAAGAGITYVAFDWCLMAARNQDPIGFGSIDLRSAVFVLASIAFAGAWIVSAVIAGAASAARSAAFTAETADACRRKPAAAD